MSDSIILERLADAAADCFYSELARTEDFEFLEQCIAVDMRKVGSMALCKCLERFDCELRANKPIGWTAHERASRTLVTLLGTITFTRTIFIDQYGCRRAWLDEILGIPARSRLSACAFLWIAAHASELSYRKTALEFRALTTETISHITVMNVVHKEGSLLKELGAEFACDGAKISQEILFLESDGLWVHLQEKRHRKEALPRFLYEQARKTKSFELKMAALYAGKVKVAPGRYRRGGLCLTCLDGNADDFWNRVWDMICKNYEAKDVNRIALGADGADWCGPKYIEQKTSATCAIDFTLDYFHIMKKVASAFPDESSACRIWAENLVIRGKGAALGQMCRRIAAHMKSGSTKTKVCDLASYAQNHAGEIRLPTHELGTIEATNAHVGAARLKGQGRSWSRRGAEAVCLIRCAMMTGRALIAPPAEVWLTKRELDARLLTLPQSASQVAQVSGRGWEPTQQPKKLTKNVAIPLYCRC